MAGARILHMLTVASLAAVSHRMHAQSSIKYALILFLVAAVAAVLLFVVGANLSGELTRAR